MVPRRGAFAWGTRVDVTIGRSTGYVKAMQGEPVHIAFSVPAGVAGPGAGERARLLLVLDAVRSERITWRAGAAALGLAPSACLDVARDHGVAIVRVDASDLDADFATLDRLARPR